VAGAAAAPRPPRTRHSSPSPPACLLS